MVTSPYVRVHKTIECNCEYHKWPLRENYSKKHDAHFCPHCDFWIESNCGDKECDYCKDRPNKPSEVVE